MGKEDYLGSILVGDFDFDYFMGSFFKSMVVGIFTNNADVAVKRSLYLVAKLGL